MLSTGRVLVRLMRLCFFDVKNLDLLKETFTTMSKKRGQLKQAMSKMVDEVMTYVDQVESRETKLDLIQCIRQVTEGKVHEKLLLFALVFCDVYFD